MNSAIHSAGPHVGLSQSTDVARYAVAGWEAPRPGWGWVCLRCARNCGSCLPDRTSWPGARGSWKGGQKRSVRHCARFLSLCIRFLRLCSRSCWVSSRFLSLGCHRLPGESRCRATKSDNRGLESGRMQGQSDFSKLRSGSLGQESDMGNAKSDILAKKSACRAAKSDQHEIMKLSHSPAKPPFRGDAEFLSLEDPSLCPRLFYSALTRGYAMTRALAMMKQTFLQPRRLSC